MTAKEGMLQLTQYILLCLFILNLTESMAQKTSPAPKKLDEEFYCSDTYTCDGKEIGSPLENNYQVLDNYDENCGTEEMPQKKTKRAVSENDFNNKKITQVIQRIHRGPENNLKNLKEIAKKVETLSANAATAIKTLRQLQKATNAKK